MPDSIHYPSISVVIPSLNQGQYLEEAILSVLGQGYPNLEIIVADGGSTDNTIEILEKYEDQISYWHSQKDKGQGDAINQGVSISSGDILCWLNSDDMYLPGTLLDIGKKFCGRTDQNHLIYGGAVSIDESNGELWSAALPASPFNASTLTYFDFVVQPSAFWTRKLWECTGEVNTKYKYVLDWEWFIRASKVTQFEYVPKFYSVYRYHSLHKTGSGNAERRREVLDIVTRYSSDYWIDLNIEIEKYYSQIKKKSKFLDSLRIPKKHLLLPLFFPKIMFKLRNTKDLYKVLTMYGFFRHKR
ncbi:MAG: glycosyltransferase family 2 protein [Candidatus Hodarchaeota archaeon]